MTPIHGNVSCSLCVQFDFIGLFFQVSRICDQFEASNIGRQNRAQVEKNYLEGNDIHLADRSPYKASRSQQIRMVLWRCAVTMLREPMLLRVRVIQVIVIGLLFGLIFFQQKMTSEGVQNINGLTYMFLMQMVRRLTTCSFVVKISFGLDVSVIVWLFV